MSNKNKVKKTDNVGMIKNVLISVTIFCVITSVLLLFMASIITVQNIPHKVFPVLTVVAVSISAFLSSFILAKLTKENGLVNGIILGVVLSLIIYIVGLLLNGTHVSEIMYIKTIAITLLSSLGGVIGVNLKKKY